MVKDIFVYVLPVLFCGVCGKKVRYFKPLTAEKKAKLPTSDVCLLTSDL